jgi:hypothetical protein
MLALSTFAVATLLLTSTPPEWSWKQILATQRIGGRLTAITVDQKNPDRIYVGTEEGSLIRSLDGGITWQEFDLTQAVIKGRSMGLSQPGLPELGATQAPDLSIFIDPPFAPMAGRVSVPFDTLFFSIRPEMIFAGFIPSTPSSPNILLKEAVNRRSNYTTPVQRIAICPGNDYPLLVATTRELYGSPDEGQTFVRLFALPGTTKIFQISCASAAPQHVAVATAIGLFISSDGGLSFDQDLTGWPGRKALAVHYGPIDPETQKPTLFAGVSYMLMKSHPSIGLDAIYPDYKNASTAPWENIRWISTNGPRRIWLATEDGLRRSADGGRNWFVPARTLFERHRIWQVETGINENGGERVVVLAGGDAPDSSMQMSTEDTIYASDDGGQSWHPFFNAISRRSFYQIAKAPNSNGGASHWWVVTSGGVWSTRVPDVAKQKIDKSAQTWAKQKLATNPPLPLLLHAMLDRIGVSAPKIEELWTKIRLRNWMPVINARLIYGQKQTQTGFEVSGSNNAATQAAAGVSSVPAQVTATKSESDLMFFVNARWQLYYTNLAVERFSFPRRALHELRRQVGFAIEDAWHERVLHLQRVARGMSDPLQIETLKARVESLDAFLETWLRGSLEELR